MRAEHDGRLLGERFGDHLEMPCIRCDRVRDPAGNDTWKAFLAIGINNLESDGVTGVRNYGEVPPVPTIRSAVKRVRPVVLIWQYMIRLPVDLKCAVLYAICIAACRMLMDISSMRIHKTYLVRRRDEDAACLLNSTSRCRSQAQYPAQHHACL